jgi:glucokinase
VTSHPAANSATSSYDAPFLAADVGGTNARLGLVRCSRDGAVDVLGYREYACADYPSLAAVLRQAAKDLASGRVSRAAVAIAAVQKDDALIAVNLPWPQLSISATRREAGLDDIAFTNDFAALAHAAPYVDLASEQLLTGQPVDIRESRTLVLGPGTGFGTALRLPTRPHATVLASESGHGSFAPGNEREIAVLRWLLKRAPHADREHAIAGPGLLNVYLCLCEIDGVTPRFSMPAEITHAALASTDAQARTALTMFCEMLGSLVGDLVLGCNAQAVFLAGGIPARIREFLPQTDFVARYLNKGMLRAALESVPIWLIEHGRLGVIGAAAWYRDRCEE